MNIKTILRKITTSLGKNAAALLLNVKRKATSSSNRLTSISIISQSIQTHLDPFQKALFLSPHHKLLWNKSAVRNRRTPRCALVRRKRQKWMFSHTRWKRPQEKTTSLSWTTQLSVLRINFLNVNSAISRTCLRTRVNAP